MTIIDLCIQTCKIVFVRIAIVDTQIWIIFNLSRERKKQETTIYTTDRRRRRKRVVPETSRATTTTTRIQ